MTAPRDLVDWYLMTDPDRLVESLRSAALTLTGSGRAVQDVEATLADLVRAAAAAIDPADGVGIARTEPGVGRSGHATSDDVRRLDDLQAELGDGPCVTAAERPLETGPVVAHDLAGADAHRWPAFAAGAAAAGYRSLMAVPLSLDPRYRSALHLYAHEPHVFDTEAQLAVGLFGLQAAMLLHGAEAAAQLDNALGTRDVIGQAKGILMERFAVDEDAAFGMLSRSSQETNVKVIDVARWLTTQAGVSAARSDR